VHDECYAVKLAPEKGSQRPNPRHFPMPVVIRCPYCIQGITFKAMMGRRGGSFLCSRCSHITVPEGSNSPWCKDRNFGSAGAAA
jgi:DNA-directed RNA polymerase subunit RPC12/RpoP